MPQGDPWTYIQNGMPPQQAFDLAYGGNVGTSSKNTLKVPQGGFVKGNFGGSPASLPNIYGSFTQKPLPHGGVEKMAGVNYQPMTPGNQPNMRTNYIQQLMQNNQLQGQLQMNQPSGSGAKYDPNLTQKVQQAAQQGNLQNFIYQPEPGSPEAQQMLELFRQATQGQNPLQPISGNPVPMPGNFPRPAPGAVPMPMPVGTLPPGIFPGEQITPLPRSSGPLGRPANAAALPNLQAIASILGRPQATGANPIQNIFARYRAAQSQVPFLEWLMMQAGNQARMGQRRAL